uniref:transketolase n=1 Tax=uncultured marine microorganism HF4000_APKG3D20 TaxID=455549 RepID=B3T797_9ZZZZ|nr:putative transketolase, thiamine diphosphate binding domain protein [uncultured marine microorganism HF4000_APKG3D20]
MSDLNTEILQQAATQARGLAIDAVHACNSGHLGLPLGAAEIGAVLFGHALRVDPDAPDWVNRDRFVLSAGHGSMFLYTWLHLLGYDLSMEDIRNFRVLHSKTPGHPEFGETPGVECTSGPLGQGVGNAVGMAIAAKLAAATFNTDEHAIFDHHVVCLAGDGCLQEGVAAEAASLAGHLGLDNFILIYDSNDVTLDAMADATQSESALDRFAAYGFEVERIEDGHNLGDLASAIDRARANDNGKPKFLEAKTLIAKGIPEVAGTAAGHGESGAKFAAESRAGLGLPEETFHVSDEVRAYFADRKAQLAQNRLVWNQRFDAWKSANPEKAALLDGGLAREVPADLMDRVQTFPEDVKLATRAAGAQIINDLAAVLPLLVSGSADLHGSTKNYLKEQGDFSRDNRAGRNILFGIREHAMGAIVNGFGYYGIFRASGATFAVFSDYMRPSVRLAALAGLPIFHVWTHDSVGVGEDGPTHQPVETISALRLIPNLDVIRPGDPEETAAAFVAAIQRTDGPTGLILTRQGVPNLNEISIAERRAGVLRGGYVARREQGELELIILASGSELSLALAAADELGDTVRVVSMPCMERFDRQDEQYRSEVLPRKCRARLAVEAGVSDLWRKYVGTDGIVVGIDRFGLSAPGGTVMSELGISVENVVKQAALAGLQA